MRKFGRFLSMVLVAAMLAGAFTTFAAAEYRLHSWELKGDDVLTIRNAEGVLAVSTSLEDESYVTGSFHMTAPGTGASSSPQASSCANTHSSRHSAIPGVFAVSRSVPSREALRFF